MRYLVTTTDRRGKVVIHESFTNRRKAWKRYRELCNTEESVSYRDLNFS